MQKEDYETDEGEDNVPGVGPSTDAIQKEAFTKD